MSRPATAPAEGERRALRNLSAQYHVAASLVRDALLDGELEWVRLVDPEAGRLDDVVIGRPGRVDAYQVKWSAYRGTVTFRQLITDSSVSGKTYPAPFKLLADGWRDLRAAHPGRVVHPHYLTHDAPSSNDGAKVGGAGDPPHLQSFLRNAWPSRATWFAAGQEAFRAAWHLKIDEIEKASSLQGAELGTFLADCELDLGFDLDEAQGSGRDRRAKDISDLAHFMTGRVAGSTGAVVLTRDDLLRGLSWMHRFELAFKHDFPVDERLYRPVEQTVVDIENALADHGCGYLALVGPPGSGKSTTLTQSLRYHRGLRLASYYAFVRDDPAQGRGEAASFLRDLCLSLEAMLPRARRGDHGDDLQGLRDRLAELMGTMHADFVESGIRTVVLVDGLDHIDREQDPTRSLIHELPHPSSVPEGVVFVLGTQPVGLEGPATSLRPITAQLAQEGRTLKMAPLSRASIRSIVDAATGQALLGPYDHERIEQLSAGHPLALAYLVKRVSACANRDEVEALFDAANPYAGEIEVEYRSYWDTLRAGPEVRELLGLAARLRGAVELSTLKRLATSATLECFVATARQYFRQDTVSTWRFFHNSFRQFVLDQTGRDAFGRPDSARPRELHRRLAEAGAEAPTTSALAWERVHHLALAGETAALLSLDHHALFRAQFLSGRPASEVKEDIDLCIRAAAQAGEALLVFRLILVDKELSDRRDALEEVDLAALELPLKDPEDLPAALIQGTDLTVSSTLAMSWAATLAIEGKHALANRVFDAAEPLGLLAGVEHIAASSDCDVLDAWARTAWRFRTLASVVAACRQVRADQGQSERAPASDNEQEEDVDGHARARILTEVALGMLAAREEERLADFTGMLNLPDEAQWLAIRIDLERVHRAIRGEATREEGDRALSRALGFLPPESLEPAVAARLADLVCRLGVRTERADPYLDRAGAPLVVEHLHDASDSAAEPTRPLFRQARALAARGRPMDPSTSVPDPARSYDLGRVLFQRILVLTAGVWGEALAGATSSPSEVVRRLGPAIRFFRRSFNEATRWHEWHYARRAAGTLFEAVLHAALAHGTEAYRATLAAVMTDWDRKQAKVAGWAVEDRRTVAIAAFRIDGDVERTATILSSLDQVAGIASDLHDRVDQLKESARAWTELGDHRQARASLQAMLETSFGVYNDRDDKIAQWAIAAARVVDAEATSDEREDAARLILSILPTLHNEHRGGGRSEAVVTILSALSRREPSAALACGQWLLEEGTALRSDVLSGLLVGQLGDDDPRTVADALVATARLVLPFDFHPGAELVTAVERVADAPLGTDPAVAAALERLRMAVRTRTRQNGRFDALIRATPAHSVPDKKADASLTRADGSVLAQEAVERLAAMPSALAAVLPGATADSIDWVRVIDALPARPDKAAFSVFARWLIARETSAKVMLALTRKAVEFGDISLAEASSACALAQSAHYGWMRNYDGGSRRAAAECMVAANPADGRRRALELLASDYVEMKLSAREILGASESILSIVAGDVDPQRVWAELRPHIGAVAEAVEEPADPPAFNDALNLGPGELPARLLLADIANPANALAWEARKGLLELLRAGDLAGFARDGLKRKATGTLKELTATLQTVVCLSWFDPALVGDLAAIASAHAWHEDATLRRLAQQTLLNIDQDLPDAPRRRELPALYRLQFNKAQMRDRMLRGHLPPPGEALPDTDDPVDLSNLFQDALDAIADRTDYSFELLARRFAQIMHEVAPPETWSARAEDLLRHRLESIELRVAVRRPRSLVAHHAFGRLVGELCDAGDLEWPPHFLDSHLLTTDPHLDGRDPEPRPDWLLVPSGKELGSHPIEQWLAGVADALPEVQRTPDGWTVLAELTRILSLDGDGVEESRAMVVEHPKLGFPDRMPDIHGFGRDFDNVGSEYPTLYGRPRQATSVIAGGPKLTDAEFIAVNPLLGSHLGWRVSPNGLFRWVDDDGTVMAETIHWHEGNTWLHERAGIDERAAEGWLVLASPEGWQGMRDALKSFVVHRAAGRRTGRRNEEEERAEVRRHKRPLLD